MHTIARLCSLLVASYLSFAASAACSNFGSPECRLEALLQSDRDLNAVYSKALGASRDSERPYLQAAQRKWLKERNQSCNLGSLSQRTDWIEVVARDDTKFNCVYATTRARLDELRALPASGKDGMPPLLARRETTFPVSHSSGKWYAEVTVLANNYGPGEDNEWVQVAATDGISLAGTQISRAGMARLAGTDGEYVIGLAIDLDNRMAYTSENGKWQREPGSASGTPLNPGTRFSIRVASGGRSLSEDLRLGFLRINTGREPFRYPTPAAYQAFYAPPTNAEASPQVDWLVPSYESVAGKTLTAWTERYWAWLIPQMKGRNPTDDLTGEQCAAQQSGPVWFLAGGDVKARITRRCTIPQGRYILLPALAQIITARPDAEHPMLCSKLESDSVAEHGSGAIESDFIVLDGHRFDALYDYRPYTPKCMTIRTEGGEIVVQDAIFYGTYVLLQPLPAGDHTISFGGELAATNAHRAVTYQIHVE